MIVTACRHVDKFFHGGKKLIQWALDKHLQLIRHFSRVSVQGVKSLGSHFACLCRGFEFYEVKKNIIFQKENGNTFTLTYNYRGFLPYATFGTLEKVALAKNRISQIFYFMYAVTN